MKIMKVWVSPWLPSLFSLDSSLISQLHKRPPLDWEVPGFYFNFLNPSRSIIYQFNPRYHEQENINDNRIKSISTKFGFNCFKRFVDTSVCIFVPIVWFWSLVKQQKTKSSRWSAYYVILSGVSLNISNYHYEGLEYDFKHFYFYFYNSLVTEKTDTRKK